MALDGKTCAEAKKFQPVECYKLIYGSINATVRPDAKPSDPKSSDIKPSDHKSSDAKSSDHKSSDAKH